MDFGPAIRAAEHGRRFFLKHAVQRPDPSPALKALGLGRNALFPFRPLAGSADLLPIASPGAGHKFLVEDLKRCSPTKLRCQHSPCRPCRTEHRGLHSGPIKPTQPYRIHVRTSRNQPSHRHPLRSVGHQLPRHGPPCHRQMLAQICPRRIGSSGSSVFELSMAQDCFTESRRVGLAKVATEKSRWCGI